jgi:serine/alanine adding enzyme
MAEGWGVVNVLDELSLEDQIEWDDFVDGIESSSIYHRAAWRDLIRDIFGHDSYYLHVKDGAGRIQGVLPLVHLKSLLFGNFLVSMPYFNYGGCLARGEGERDALHQRAVELARKLSASHIEFRDENTGVNVGLPERTDKVSMRLELPDDPDKLWSALGSKLRSHIKRPLRESPVVRTGGLELLDDFYKVFAVNMRDLGTPVYGKDFFKSILENFKDHCHLLVVSKDEQPVAAGFLMGHKGMMEIPWASSLREYNRYGFNMLMYWEALKLSIEKGFTIFDFGRSSHDSGTYRFKKQWGAQPVQLHWHYWLMEGDQIPILNPTNPKYSLAIKLWKKLPLPIANMIGPRLVKNLP